MQIKLYKGDCLDAAERRIRDACEYSRAAVELADIDKVKEWAWLRK